MSMEISDYNYPFVIFFIDHDQNNIKNSLDSGNGKFYICSGNVSI